MMADYDCFKLRHRIALAIIPALFPFTLVMSGQTSGIAAKRLADTKKTRTAPSPACLEALDAIRALRSATDSESGITYRDYVPRVLDSKIKVDRCQDVSAGIVAIQLAMREYELASRAWGAKFATRFEGVDAMVEVGNVLERNPDISKCPAVRKTFETVGLAESSPETLAASWGAERAKTLAQMPWIVLRPALIGLLTGQTPGILWSCASTQVTEAERLLQAH